MNGKGKLKIPPMAYPCLTGLCLFLTATAFGFAVTRDGIVFALLGGYLLFALFSFIQQKIILKMQSMRELTAVYNLLLFVKTAGVFCMFLLPGTFGNIHYGDFIHVFHTIFLFCCILFLIVNFYFEKIYLNKRVSASGAPNMLKNGFPIFLARCVNYYPLVYSAFVFSTVIIHTLAMGFIGPVWLMFNILAFSVFSLACQIALAGENGIAACVTFVIAAVARFAFSVIFYSVFVPSADSFMQTTAFVTAYTVLEYFDIAVLCVGAVIDILAVCFIVRGLIRKKKTYSAEI